MKSSQKRQATLILSLARLLAKAGNLCYILQPSHLTCLVKAGKLAEESLVADDIILSKN
jgi:hypothetical protein